MSVTQSTPALSHALSARCELQEYALAIVVVLLFVVGAILEPDTFPTWDNIRNMLTQASVIGVLAIGMTFVIATAGIDLSVGSILAAAGVFGGILVDPRARAWCSSLGAIGVRDCCSGRSTRPRSRYGRVVPFIATLAMFSIAKGLALLLNDKQPVSLLDLNGGSFGEPAVGSLLWFGTGEIVGIPVSVYVFLGITIAGWILLNRTRYGRHVVAVGGNREAARIAGVPVRRIDLQRLRPVRASSSESPPSCSARGSAAPRRSAATSTSSTRSAPS